MFVWLRRNTWKYVDHTCPLTIAILVSFWLRPNGNNYYGQCAVPELPEGIIYNAAAAGMYHTVLVQSDGVAVAFGKNDEGQCAVPSEFSYSTASAIPYPRANERVGIPPPPPNGWLVR